MSRQIPRMMLLQHEFRNSLVSASASLTTGTATSLITGEADYFLDIQEVSFSNNSTVAVGVSLVNDATILKTVQIPISGTVQLQFDNPLRQQTKSTPWFADMDDVTGTTVTVQATLLKKL